MKKTHIALSNPHGIHLPPLRNLQQAVDRLPACVPLPLREVTFVFLGRKAMATANWRFLQHEGPTDVITFHHGEILICADVARREAKARKLPVWRELLLYAVHGWLHLAGWDDQSDTLRASMEIEQERVMQSILASRSP